ncbi:MAG: TIGR03089 family protein, partial [Propionicimonas sp.]
MENPIITALAARVRRAGADPLVTWYRPADGARTELSGRTFANWVDKTANLLDALGVEGPISAPLNLAHPGHWMSLVWPVAAWQHGCGYTVGVPEPSAAVAVVGPDRPEPVTGAITIACSLHPLGLGLRHLPEEVLDFTTEALAESDAHWSVPVDPEALAWADADRSLSHA